MITTESGTMDLGIPIGFLRQLAKNNNRDWFHANKALYIQARQEFEQLIDIVIAICRDVDPEIDVVSANECIFRIYRDVRFSKSKLPYKTNFGAFIAKGGRKSPFAGYYVHLEPDGSFVGGGAYRPESKYLRAIRNEIFENVEEYLGILNSVTFKTYFDELYGEKLKLAPRGFPRDFAAIDLLKNKHYAVIHKVDDAVWTSATLLDTLAEIFRIQSTFNTFINRAIEKSRASGWAR